MQVLIQRSYANWNLWGTRAIIWRTPTATLQAHLIHLSTTVIWVCWAPMKLSLWKTSEGLKTRWCLALSSKGINVEGLDLSSAEGHGRVLTAFADSNHAFTSLKEILQDIHNHMMLMAKSCEELVNAAGDTNDADLMASARIVTRVLLRWSLGYYLYNPYSKRYSSSFRAIKAALQDNKTKFKTAINRHLAVNAMNWFWVLRATRKPHSAASRPREVYWP